MKNNYEKDIIIENQQKEIKSLTNEIINLTAEINELKIILSTKKNNENRLEDAEILINNLNKQIKDISIQSKEKEKSLKQEINDIISEYEKQKYYSKLENIINNQKMSVINYIEMENEIYKNEVNDLKEKQKIIEEKVKEKIEKVERENIFKYKNLKKKMMEIFKESKENLSELKTEYMDINERLAILQYYQLLNDLKGIKRDNNLLVKENKILKNKIVELEKELFIHKKVETKLAQKFKNSLKMQNTEKPLTLFNKKEEKQKKISYSSANSPKLKNHSSFNIFSNNFLNNKIKDKLKNSIIANNINHYQDYSSNKTTDRSKQHSEIFNKLKNKKDEDTNFNRSYFGKGSFSNNLFHSTLNKSKSELFKGNVTLLEKHINIQKEENEKLKFTNDLLKQKLYKYENKYNGLFRFLEKSLEHFFKDVENKIKEKGIEKIAYIDMEKIKKFDFSSFNNDEKYNLMILIMNYLLPLVTINFNSNCSLKKDLFCTNLNIIDRKFNKNKSYIKDNFLKRAFLGKNCKLKADLCIDGSKNNSFCNSIPILRKNKQFMIQ